MIRLEPTNPKRYSDRGAIYLAKGDRDRAIADYDQAIRLDPSYATAHFNRAYAYHLKATMIVPSPATMRRSGSIRTMRMPSTTGE